MKQEIGPLYRSFTRQSVTLHSKYPCCGRRCRFVGCLDVPVQTYNRKCACGAVWHVRREELAVRSDMRIDKLDWTTPD